MIRGAGFRCPACGATTSVSETRAIRGGVRRRRVCGDPACNHKFSTAELLAPAGRQLDVALVAMPLRDLEVIATIASSLIPRAVATQDRDETTGDR